MLQSYLTNKSHMIEISIQKIESAEEQKIMNLDNIM